MPEAPNGTPYPDGDSEPNVPYWIQQLAESVDPYVGDTGWVPITINSTYVAGGRFPSVRRIGQVVYLSGYFEDDGFAANTSHLVGVVPEGFRPNSNRAMQCGSASADKPHMLRVISNGNLTIDTTALANWYAIDGITWTVD